MERAVPFHSIIDAGTKFVPFTVKRQPAVPAFTRDGLRDVTEGTGFDIGLIVNSAAPEFPPPGGGLLMLTAAEPEFVISDALICACNCVLEE